MVEIDPQKLIGDVLRLGTVESVDLSEATCRVRVGEIVTGDIPWIAPRAGALRIWAPPSVGEQVLLVCPEGDELAGMALPGLFSDAFTAPRSDDSFHAEFADGAWLNYEPVHHTLTVWLPAGGTADITAPGGLKITGPVTIAGKVTVTEDVEVAGTVKATTDVIGAGKSLKSHKHLGVQTGGGVSGLPQ